MQPGSEFLIETDPQFTQYSKFISSDYMLQKLGLNPQQTEQRLGDGFYEQQQAGNRGQSALSLGDADFFGPPDFGWTGASPKLSLDGGTKAMETHSRLR